MFRPPINRAMRVLDRHFFQNVCLLSAARVRDRKNISKIRHDLHKSCDLLLLRHIQSIKPDPEYPNESDGRKCILLRPEISHSDQLTWSDTVTQLVRQDEISIIPYELRLEYGFWSAHEILSAILPEHLLDEPPTGFNPVGHVAHLNLREKYLPYKHIIGQVTLDKSPHIETVINKTETLGEDNEFRVLDYEILAGRPSLAVEAKENGCTYRFDFAKVFWNSRLNTEREYLVQKFQPGQAVCDVMAGVGPFAIPAAKKRVFVWANDLNPFCYQGLQDSVRLNRADQFVKMFNQDGHEFIKTSSRELRDQEHSACIPIKVSRIEAIKRGDPRSRPVEVVPAPKFFSHFVMNLPASALDFLPDYVGLYAGLEREFEPHSTKELPMIHCYCFGPNFEGEDEDTAAGEEIICKQISSKLNIRLARGDTSLQIRHVRVVAPNKSQYCASFRLPPDVAFRQG